MRETASGRAACVAERRSSIKTGAFRRSSCNDAGDNVLLLNFTHGAPANNSVVEK
jgi:hypothetical protein